MAVRVVEDCNILCFDKSKSDWENFRFDKCWDTTVSEQDIFVHIEPYIRSVFEGYSSSIITCRSSRVDLTNSVIDNSTSFESEGILQKTFYKLLDFLCDEKGANSNFQYSLNLSALEISDEQVRDLLSGDSKEHYIEDEGIRLGRDGEVNIQGLTKHLIENMDGAVSVMEQVVSGILNTLDKSDERFSRYHYVFIIDLKISGRKNAAPSVGKLYVVDISGCWKPEKSGIGDFQGAEIINRSLIALGEVVEALTKKLNFVPYRNSTLTFLLQNSFNGSCRAFMMFNISPCLNCADEALSILLLASKLRKVRLDVTKKYENSDSTNVECDAMALKAEIQTLKYENMNLRDSLNLSNRGLRKREGQSVTISQQELHSYEIVTD